MLEISAVLEGFLYFTMFVLILAIGAGLVRLLIGPTIWDRILMVNLISIKVVMLVVIFATVSDSLLVLDVAIAYGIVGFLTITLLSKFIMTGGREK